MKKQKSNIAGNLSVLRQIKKLSQKEVAEKIGVSRQTVAKWEAGESIPDILNCDALARLYDVELKDLIHHDAKGTGLVVKPKGKAFLGASVPMVLLMAGMEAMPHIPVLSWLDSTRKEYLIRQLPILLLGLACFGICLMLAYRISAKRFETVNL